MSKYTPLEEHLIHNGRSEVPMTFDQIEQLIGENLPNSARKHRPWWSNNPSNSVITRSWLSAGYKTSKVDMVEEKLVFEKVQEPKSDKPHPLIGCLKAKIQISIETDLTAPTGEQMESSTLKKFGNVDDSHPA